MNLQIDAPTWASQASSNESYPCSPFVITTYNVSIVNFQFDIDQCTANLPSWFAVAGQPSSLFWIMSTPVIIMADNAINTTLTLLSFAQGTGASNTRGDAIVRVIPETAGAIVNLDGSVFTTVVGRPDMASPIYMSALPNPSYPGVIIGVYSGTIRTSGTRVATLRLDANSTSLGAWIGTTAIASGILPASCPVCKSEEELHRTNTIYIIIGSVVGGAVLIVVSIAIFVHVRNRRKAEQKAALAKAD
jgi:hypothetical protein